MCHIWSEGGSDRLLEEPAQQQFDVFDTLCFMTVNTCLFFTKSYNVVWIQTDKYISSGWLLWDSMTPEKLLLSLVKDRSGCVSIYIFFSFNMQVFKLLKRLFEIVRAMATKKCWLSTLQGRQHDLSDDEGQLVKKRNSQGHTKSLRYSLLRRSSY